MIVEPIYEERYRLVTQADGPFGKRKEVAWSELGRLPLCLLTLDMQNRRIIQQMLTRHAPSAVVDSMQTNSSVVMAQLVASGRWSSIMPPVLVDATRIEPGVVSLPIVGPALTHAVGLAMPAREPMTPLSRALVSAARELAPTLDYR
jgi:DNA-binding transcriptional LysR family regulator